MAAALVVDEDPSLFLTWEQELEFVEEAERVRREWSQSDELLAGLIELTSVHRVEFLAVNTKKGARLPDVARVRRPGQPDPNEKQMVSPREMAQRLMRG